jgi:hypothetical protein
MIWFLCRQCGKRHGRPESAIGTLIFCTCGQGNTVPWESTAPAPAPGEEPIPVELARPPRLEPVPVGEERRATPPPLPRDVGRPRGARPDPAVCLNHHHLASEVTCADCQEHFCRHCVAEFQGRTLCGPCKNFQIRQLNRPPRSSSLAIVALILSLLAGPMGPVLSALSATAGAMILALIALLLQLLALALGGLVLQLAPDGPRTGGQWLAVTAIVASGVSAVLTGSILYFGGLQAA